ncbi:flotillin family protein [Myxococcota bacterium]|nr:flotillin family protein [Myxococcota bacterium]MBU1412243.1 flotillin family protein [Myxococcota bacterium]MBU1509230.1 flotillin family protein [Myxococcota bacterium]PKN23974.1 MAG: flotillin [Deltaproteobacteria bacterium HGW-Deltaproteobacteria-22]
MANMQPFFWGIGAGFGVYIFLKIIINYFFYIGKPNEVLIFSGRSHRYPDGSVRGYRYVIGGWAFRFPIIERVDRMDLSELPVNVSVSNAYSKGGIAVNVTAIANIKISSEPIVLDAAIEHFLGQNREQIAHVARETLEGHLRGVLATMTPEQINEDRLSFSERVEADVIPDFNKLGLHLDNFKMQSISDKEEYLLAVGRKKIEEIKKLAAVAESDANKVAKNIEEEAKGVAKATNEEVDMVVKTAANELATFVANMLAQVTSEEERTIVAAAQSRAEAEQKLQQIRAELESKRRDVEEVLPAETRKRMNEILAVGEAAYMQKRGEATAQVLALTHEVWKEAGPIAKDVYILQQIELIIEKVVDAVKNVEMGEINLLDAGDASTLRHHVQSYPAMVGAVLQELKSITGIDVAAVLSPDAKSAQRLPAGTRI